MLHPSPFCGLSDVVVWCGAVVVVVSFRPANKGAGAMSLGCLDIWAIPF